MTETRALDAGSVPDRFARGWHCLGLESAFNDGKPHEIFAFGGKLVVWADSQGNLKVLDGYCRHMGGDLTQGTVKGDEIACPFHDWTVVESLGAVFVWHDPEGSPVDMEALPPELPGVGTDAYTEWTWDVIPVDNAHCREIIDNVVDMAHFFYIHFAFPTNFRNVFEGDQATQFMESTGRPDMKAEGYGDEDLVLKSVATYFGPSYMINWLDTDYKGFLTKVVLINCHVPTGPNSFNLQFGLCVEKPEGVDEKTAKYIGDKYAETFKVGFLQDVNIWLNKAPVQNPLLCEEDGPVYQLRRWYEQFYVDKADIEPEMVERFEFEVDTTKANENWRAEVAENLARKEAEDREAEKAEV